MHSWCDFHEKTDRKNSNESEDIFIQIKNEDFDFDATVFSYRKTMLLRYGNLN